MLIGIILLSGVSGILLFYGLKQILVICSSILIILFMPLLFSYYFMVTDDSIIIRHGLSSFQKKYRSSFKTRVIMIKDINGLDVENGGKAIMFNMKDGGSIYFSIGGYFNRGEIIRLVYDVKKQVY